jgi:hypothetical protein
MELQMISGPLLIYFFMFGPHLRKQHNLRTRRSNENTYSQVILPSRASSYDCVNQDANKEISELLKISARFEAFTAVTMKDIVFWDVALCRSCVNGRFGGTYRLHLQGRK